MDAKEHTAARHEYAVQVKRANVIHSACTGRPGYDPEVGVVCYCGEVIGDPHPDDLMAPEVLPASQTTAASRGAVPLQVPASTEKVVSESNLASAVHPQDPILARLDVIDPTQPYTPEDVEYHLLDAVARLERGAHYERVCAEDVYDKQMRYEAAHARALLRAHKETGGAQDVRSAYAQVECEAEYVDLMIAKMKLKAINGTMHSLRSMISAYQTISNSVRTAYGAAGRPSPGFNPKF